MDDVALGHTAKLRWNETDKWVWSEHIVHPPIIDREAFDQVQALPGGWASAHADTSRTTRRPYALRGCLGAASASGACKATGPTARRTTAAGSRRVRPGQPDHAPLNVCLLILERTRQRVVRMPVMVRERMRCPNLWRPHDLTFHPGSRSRWHKHALGLRSGAISLAAREPAVLLRSKCGRPPPAELDDRYGTLRHRRLIIFGPIQR